MEIEYGAGKQKKPIDFNYSSKHIHEVEFLLLEQMVPLLFSPFIRHPTTVLQDCCLIVYHAYRPLVEYVSDVAEAGKEEKELLALAWRLVNDSLRTDAALLFPPFQIALGSLVFSSFSLGDSGCTCLGHKKGPSQVRFDMFLVKII